MIRRPLRAWYRSAAPEERLADAARSGWRRARARRCRGPGLASDQPDVQHVEQDEGPDGDAGDAVEGPRQHPLATAVLQVTHRETRLLAGARRGRRRLSTARQVRPGASGCRSLSPSGSPGGARIVPVGRVPRRGSSGLRDGPNRPDASPRPAGGGTRRTRPCRMAASAAHRASALPSPDTAAPTPAPDPAARSAA